MIRYHVAVAFDAIIARFGLPAIFAGSGVEGEPFALAGGLLAHRHLVPLWAAMLAAAAGACLVDHGWFVLGRRFRSNRRVRAIVERPGFARSLALLEAHPIRFILLFRFAYGLRAVAPVAIGTSRVPVRIFVLLDVTAAAIWGSLATWLGYRFGRVIDPWTRHTGTLALIGVVLVLVTVASTYRVLKRGRASRTPA